MCWAVKQMNTNLTEISDRLAAGLSGADAGDPSSLAELHSRFEELCRHAAELEGDRRQLVCSAATQAGKVLEQLILQQSADVAGSMKQVAGSIEQIRAILAPAAAVTVV